jgi:cytochrome c biogenesis protein ResB
VAAPLRSSVVTAEGRTSATLPDAQVEIRKLRGEYFEGQYRYDFGGVLVVEDRSGRRELPFAVNKPAEYQGYQFTLHEYGFAPQLVLERDGRPVFDYFLNLRHGEEGDYFELPDGSRAMVMFFPDFIREGGKIGTRSKEPRNPVAMVKIFREDAEVFRGLFKPGEEAVFEGTRLKVPAVRRWVTLIVTREQGILLVMVGGLLCMGGLLARFLSNERRIEFELAPCGEGSLVRVRGYSRYYPAFLEKEVLQMTQQLKEELS